MVSEFDESTEQIYTLANDVKQKIESLCSRQATADVTVSRVPLGYNPDHHAMGYDEFMAHYAKFTVEKATDAEFDYLVYKEWEITKNNHTLKKLKKSCQSYLDHNKKNEAAELTSQLLEAGDVIKKMQAKMVEKECQVKGMR